MIITEEDKRLLLSLARNSIAVRLATGERENDPIPLPTASLSIHCGAFVSLYVEGKLRGCIGHIRGEKPLVKTVAEMATAAAFHDPRFPPVTTAELEKLEYEISVLTPLRRISDVAEIKVGTHGIYMKSDSCAGLLLPQVATEWGWDRKTFLERTCIKAGLPEDAWKDEKTEIYIFSADVFSPEDS